MVRPACHPGSVTWTAKAHLEDDIGGVLPYLNAELEGADYQHESKVLIWHDGTRKHAFRPREIAVAPMENRAEAARLIEDVIRRVNATWRRRERIEPKFERRELPSVLEIYKLLPRTNCKECGAPTCMAFANHLRQGETGPSQCPHLSADQQDKLARLFGGA